jgi:predicted Zn-dependent peptidase
LRNITGAELEIAKNTLKGKLSRNNSSTWRRLEERTKSLYYIGQTNEHIGSQIDGLTVSQVQEAVEASLRTPLTFVTRGGEVNTLPSYDNIAKRFN